MLGTRAKLLFACLQVVWLTGLSPLFAQSETLVFERIGIHQGLPDEQILGLIQDHYGYVWFGTMSGLVQYDGYHFVQFTHRPDDSTSLSDIAVFAELEDHDGYIWAGSHSGLNRWDRRTKRFQRYFTQQGLPDDNITDVYEAKNGVIWVGTFRGLAWFDGHLFHPVPIKKEGLKNKRFKIFSITEDDHGNILAATRRGIAIVDPKKKRGIIESFPSNKKDKEALQFLKLYKDRKGGIWAGTDKGLFYQSKGARAFIHIPLPGSIADQAVYDLIQDSRGNLWVSTLNSKGLLRLDPDGTVAHFGFSLENSFSISDNTTRDLMIDNLGQLWIGTNSGLNKADINAPRFTFLQQEPGLMRPENKIHQAYLDRKGGLWFSTTEKQRFYSPHPGKKAAPIAFLDFLPQTTQLKNFCQTSDGAMWFATDDENLIRYANGKASRVYQQANPRDSLALIGSLYMEEDTHEPQLMWLASKNGLCKFNTKTGQRLYFPPKRNIGSLRTNATFAAFQAPDGYIYLQLDNAFNGKLGRFNKKGGYYELIETGEHFPDGKNSLRIRQFTATPDGVIWMATTVGLGRFDPRNDAFDLFTTANGLYEDVVMGLASDRQGNLWIKGLHVLSKYAHGSFQHFQIARDMKSFNTIGAIVAPDGQIFFPGDNGFYAFYPESVSPDTTLPRLVLTDFQVLNKSLALDPTMESVKEIELKYPNYDISIAFSALHLRAPQYNRYCYYLKGFDQHWREAGLERRAVYTNLRAGVYTFSVKASNADGVWNTTPLAIQIKIKPPIWRSWAAYVLYASIFFVLFYAFYRIQLRRRLDQAAVQRLQELDAFKTRFYTNITHEFRTPLTVILGMADQVLDNPLDHFRHGLELIRRNGLQLLGLVNQILSLSKIESGRLTLHYQYGDVLRFIKYLIDSFHSLAEQKKITLHLISDFDSFSMDFDPEYLQQIVSNLLSNAIKFTPEGGQVYLSLALGKISSPTPGKALLIKVRDTGPGIPAAHLPYIFDRFYQAEEAGFHREEGTGIGLALTKELVSLMNGNIKVENPATGGVTFVVTLPVRQTVGLEPAIWNQPPAITPATNDISYFDNGKNPEEFPLILIAEDNKDLAAYLFECLAVNYRPMIAQNGHQALDMAYELIPDLVICDVMMPETDGFEVCARLKKDERTNHIPIILLTAKADRLSRLEGFERGADDYIVKPFAKDELLIRIKNMLEIRRQLQAHYLSAASLAQHKKSNGDMQQSHENAFVKKARSIVEEHISDSRFGVEQFCQALMMSHSQVHRKLSALTGYSVVGFIRLIRLERAKALLLDPEKNISTVAFECGFENPAYFGKTFREAFDITPGQWRLHQNNEAP